MALLGKFHFFCCTVTSTVTECSLSVQRIASISRSTRPSTRLRQEALDLYPKEDLTDSCYLNEFRSSSSTCFPASVNGKNEVHDRLVASAVTASALNAPALSHGAFGHRMTHMGLATGTLLRRLCPRFHACPK
jgi:hypothetical protein